MKWTDKLIEEGIKNAVKQLNLDRMPTADELKEIGLNALHCKISRTKKYSGWAKELGLELKSGSTTRKGTKYENFVTEWLIENDFDVKSTPHKHPFDLQINNCVKIDVKVSSPYITKNGTKYIFAGMKGIPTCDIYALVTLNLNEQVENIYIIPSHIVQQQTLNLRTSEFELYKNNILLIDKYSKFFNSNE